MILDDDEDDTGDAEADEAMTRKKKARSGDVLDAGPMKRLLS